MSEPVTIGGQTFVNDPDKGWVDRKTKLAADKALITLLNSLELKPIEKKLRVKIDKKIDPVTIAGQKFVYDSNSASWIDEKTKIKAPDNLQKTLNTAVNLSSIEAAVEGVSADVEKAFGALGQVARGNIKVDTKTPKKQPGQATSKVRAPTQSASIINPIIVKMISVLASIDNTIKQQLDQTKELAAQNSEQADENRLEAKDNNKQLIDLSKDEEKEHATKVNAGSALLAGSAAYLIAKNFDPLMEMVSSLGETVYNLAKTTFDAAATLNGWLSWMNNLTFTDLFGGGATAPPTETGDKPGKQAGDATPVRQTTPAAPAPDAKPQQPAQKGWFSRALDWVTEKITGGKIDQNTGKLAVNGPDGKPLKMATTPTPQPTRSLPVDTMRSTSGQGMRQHPVFGGRAMHTGIDIAGKTGTPIKAAAAGTVSFAGYARKGSGYGGYGNVVVIQHADGTQSTYGHLNAISAQVGDVVKPGQVIGKMGSTGISTGSHLHFQVNRANARTSKQGVLDAAAWLRGATVSQTIEATREDTVGSRVASVIDSTGKAVLLPLEQKSVFSGANIAALNRVVTADSISKINRAEVEKTGDKVDAVQPYVPPPPPPPSMPNLNQSRPELGIKTPPVPEDKRILVDYLNYMHVLPIQTGDSLVL